MWLQENVLWGKTPAPQAVPPKYGRNKLSMLAGRVHLNVYTKNTSETWKYLVLHLTDDPCCQAEAFFLQWTESLLKMYCSAVQNTPKQTTVYFATVLQMWHCRLLTILGATAYGYHSVQSTLSHTFYYRLNMCFNILILPQ